MARTWPAVADLQKMLYSAGLLTEYPPLGRAESFVDYQGALDAARTDFERDVGICPFLADGSEAKEQYVQVSGSPTGGTFKWDYAGQVTSSIAYNASAATVQAALEALSNIAVGQVSVTGDAGGPWTVVFDSDLFPYSWLSLNTNAMTGGSSPTMTFDEPMQFDDGPNGYLFSLRDSWFSIRSVAVQRQFGSDGIAQTLHTHYEYVYRLNSKTIDALRFYSWTGGGPNGVGIIGRRGVSDDLPANVFKGILGYAALQPDLLPLFEARVSKGKQEWREGDVMEKYGSGGAFSAQRDAWQKSYDDAVNSYFRTRMSVASRL